MLFFQNKRKVNTQFLRRSEKSKNEHENDCERTFFEIFFKPRRNSENIFWEDWKGYFVRRKGQKTLKDVKNDQQKGDKKLQKFQMQVSEKTQDRKKENKCDRNENTKNNRWTNGWTKGGHTEVTNACKRDNYKVWFWYKREGKLLFKKLKKVKVKKLSSRRRSSRK